MKIAADMSISGGTLSAYVIKYGEGRVVEVLQHAWNGYSLGRRTNPPGWVRKALEEGWKFCSQRPPSGLAGSFRPEAHGAKEARRTAERRKWKEKADEIRPKMEELGQARVAELKAVVLAEITDPKLREAFERADPMACDRPIAVQLAALIWEKHRRKMN